MNTFYEQLTRIGCPPHYAYDNVLIYEDDNMRDIALMIGCDVSLSLSGVHVIVTDRAKETLNNAFVNSKIDRVPETASSLSAYRDNTFYLHAESRVILRGKGQGLVFYVEPGIYHLPDAFREYDLSGHYTLYGDKEIVSTGCLTVYESYKSLEDPEHSCAMSVSMSMSKTRSPYVSLLAKCTGYNTFEYWVSTEPSSRTYSCTRVGDSPVTYIVVRERIDTVIFTSYKTFEEAYKRAIPDDLDNMYDGAMSGWLFEVREDKIINHEMSAESYRHPTYRRQPVIRPSCRI